MKLTLNQTSTMHIASFAALAALGLIMAGGVEAQACVPANYNTYPACAKVDVGSLGFQIPTLGDILTFAIRAFFAIAGLAALFYMLLGAFAWVTSGGDKDAITAAREKIQAAVVGMILLVAVLAVVWTLEQVIFKRRICLGLSCSVTLPGLIESTSGQTSCCACLKKAGGLMTPADLIANPKPAAVPAAEWRNVIDLFNPVQKCAEF